MCILGLLLPPVPFFLMTGPKFTLRTKEFWISVLLTIFLYFGAIIYAVWFIYIGFDEGRKTDYQRLDNDLERGESARAGETHSATAATAAGAEPEQGRESYEAHSDAPLPSYEESEGANLPSDGKDSKHLGDHKIQH